MAQFIKYTKTNPTRPQSQSGEGAQRGRFRWSRYRLWFGCDITNTKALERIAKIKGIKLEKANFSFICRFKQFVRLCSADWYTQH
jgi:hypothetical protein